MYIVFVIPWIGMMLALLGRRQWCWVWSLAYVWIFSTHFFTIFINEIFISGGPSNYNASVYEVDYSIEALNFLEPVMKYAQRYDWIILLVGSSVVSIRLFIHKFAYCDENDNIDLNRCWQNDESVCMRCVEPFVFFALWMLHILFINELYALFARPAFSDYVAELLHIASDLHPWDVLIGIGRLLSPLLMVYLPAYLIWRFIVIPVSRFKRVKQGSAE